MTPRTDGIERGWIIAPIVAGVGMAWWTWGTWPDALVDFGRELYLPWRITEGQRLYADLASFNGPLSPYVNAWWFRLLGVSVQSLVVANLALVAVLAVLVYRAVATLADRYTAIVGTVLFLLIFAFGEYDRDVANFNYVTPYSHELVHGMVLAFAAINCLFAYLRRERRAPLVGVGLLTGLIFLTKPEVFIAAAAALGVGSALAVWTVQGKRKRRWPLMALVLAATAVPPIVALALLSLSMPVGVAARGMLAPYGHLVNPAMAALPFYAEMLGTDHLAASLATVLLSASVYAALIGGLIALAFVAKAKRLGVELALVAGLALFALGMAMNRAVVAGIARPLPLFLVGALASTALTAWRTPRTGDDQKRQIRRFSFFLFATILTLKMALNAHVYRYGFVLVMPAFLVLICAIAAWMPTWLEQRGADGGFFRVVGVAALGTVALIFLLVHHERLVTITTAVGSGRDRFLTDVRSGPVNAMLGEISRRLSPSDRLVVLPEGAMLNYLAKRGSSVPFPNFMPPEFVMFGEDTITAAFAAQPPEYVIVVDRPMGDYGSRGFGIDYAQSLDQWVSANYREIASVPGAAYDGPRFAMRMLQHRNVAP